MEGGTGTGFGFAGLDGFRSGPNSLSFVLDHLIELSPYLLISIGLAAYAQASGADNLIAQAFQGRKSVMILFASMMGGFHHSAPVG